MPKRFGPRFWASSTGYWTMRCNSTCAALRASRHGGGRVVFLAAGLALGQRQSLLRRGIHLERGRIALGAQDDSD